jgi:hypothetical protein
LIDLRHFSYFRSSSGGGEIIEMNVGGPASVVREPAREELIRAEAELTRTLTTAVRCLLGCLIALTVVEIIAVTVGCLPLGLGCLAAIGALAAALGRAKGPPR